MIRLLAVDPTKRIGLADILLHPWIKRYQPQLESDEGHDDISERALAHLSALGHTRLEVLKALVVEDTTNLTTAYHLLAKEDVSVYI